VFKTKNQRKTVVTMYEIRMQLRELSIQLLSEFKEWRTYKHLWNQDYNGRINVWNSVGSFVFELKTRWNSWNCQSKSCEATNDCFYIGLLYVTSL